MTTLGSAGLASRDDPDHVIALAETVDYDDEAEGRKADALNHLAAYKRLIERGGVGA